MLDTWLAAIIQIAGLLCTANVDPVTNTQTGTDAERDAAYQGLWSPRPRFSVDFVFGYFEFALLSGFSISRA